MPMTHSVSRACRVGQRLLDHTGGRTRRGHVATRSVGYLYEVGLAHISAQKQRQPSARASRSRCRVDKREAARPPLELAAYQ